jgi:hypothetical protein
MKNDHVYIVNSHPSILNQLKIDVLFYYKWKYV